MRREKGAKTETRHEVSPSGAPWPDLFRPSTAYSVRSRGKTWTPRTSPGAGSLLLFLLYAFDDAQVAIGAVAEHLQRFLVPRAVMRRGGVIDAVELDDDDPLQQPRLIRFDGSAARQKAPAGGLDCRTGKLGIPGQRVGVRDRTIRRHPIGFRHSS